MLRGIPQMAALMGLSLRGDFIPPPTPSNALPIFSGAMGHQPHTRGFRSAIVVIKSDDRFVYCTHVSRSKRYPYNSAKRGWARV